jgi:flagellar biosynthesis/type III secretory pathway protein FliH
MCNLSEGVKQIGREEGIEIGMELGLELGLELGHEERTIISVETLMETMSWSLQQAMDALKIPEADRAYYANAINGKQL